MASVIFPLAYLALGSSMTALLIVAGLSGQATLAAEMAVIQGALAATFYAFSANARSLILQGHDELTTERLLAKRVLALPLLGAMSYLLCAEAAGVSPLLALLFIVRRSCEWLAEVRLCEIEVAGDETRARRALLVQAMVTVVVAAAILILPTWLLPAMTLFALAPLMSSTPRFKIDAFSIQSLRLTLRGISPHVGSTAIDGISLYIVRLMVFVIVGAEVAGLLFTGFVLGSFVATLFAGVLGPTLALRRARNSGSQLDRWVRGTALLMLVGGAAVAAASAGSGAVHWLGRPGYFWLALGLSLCGAAVMIAAQMIRLRIFDQRAGEVLFGPDVLRNLTVIIIAPVLYRIGGANLLAALYLATALATLLSYWGARHAIAQERPATRPEILTAAIAAGILLPVFVLLTGHVFHSRWDPLLDLGASALTVPLPLSLAVCFAGIVIVARYRDAGFTLATIFFLFVAMVLTTVISTRGEMVSEWRKIVLLFQFLVPAFALVLGQMLGARPDGLRAAALGFCVVLALLVPAQLLSSLGSADSLLSEDLWLFSVYQHLQYVPAVVISAYFVALFVLWQDSRIRWFLVAFAPLIALYTVSSYSTLAIVFTMGGGALFAVLRHREWAARGCAGLLAVTCAAGLYANRDKPPMLQKFERSNSATETRLSQAPVTSVSRDLVEMVPGPMQARLHYWSLHARGIVESGGTVLFGHRQPIDRSVAPSAHNYYLDFVYNFGVLAFLPFAWLIGYTLRTLWRARASLPRDLPLLGLAATVLYALFLDSVFKVPLRQPYPGIFFFFLWGLLIAQLQSLRR